MHAHGIDVFHVADRDTVSGAVAHHLVLDFLPAGDAALHQNLAHAGKTQAVCQNLLQLHLVMGDTAAASAQRIGGTQHHRIADFGSEGNAVLDVRHHQGGRAGLSDLFHGVLEFLSILRLADGLRGGSKKLYVM